MGALRLEEISRVAEAAADRAREEVVPRFRRVATELKDDGSPVTEADRAAELAIREVLHKRTPDFGILGEEFGDEGRQGRARWVVDPIDGTIAFSRGIPLFGTLIALLEGSEPVFGLLDLPMLDERFLGWKGGGCRRNGEPVRVSQETDLGRAIVSHGDPICFERAGERAAFERLAREVPILRGYTDAFGHAQVLCGAVDVMIDLDLSPWDIAVTQVLVPEAGGRCALVPDRSGRSGVVIGSPALVEQLLGFLSRRPDGDR